MKSPTKSPKSAKSTRGRRIGRLKKLEPAKPEVNIDLGSDDEDPIEELDDEIEDGLETKDEKMPDLVAAEPTKLKERYEYKPIIQQEIVFLTPENRKTSEIMTRFEFTEIISHRAKQIENGGTCFTDTEELTDPIEMAEKELRDRKCPLDIIRMITDKVAESWHANELAVMHD